MRYRSKVFEIEAVQATEQRIFDWRASEEPMPNGLIFSGFELVCQTRQGPVPLTTGDWIIQESNGSGCYPCKSDVFAAKYEAIE